MSKIIGIDLGTTNSCVYLMEGKEAKCELNNTPYWFSSGERR